jgi:mannose-6-phosphate isomerase-like protein (cupin superfamily)
MNPDEHHSSESRSRVDEYLDHIKGTFRTDFDQILPEKLVVSLSSAEWVDPKRIPNPSRIAPLLDLQMRSIDIAIQEIPSGTATDMQRHAHEAVHFVLQGSGYSEIGARKCPWKEGDFVHTPVWVWHRHYNTGLGLVRMLIIENSKLLESLGLHQRQTAGLIDYKTLKKTNGAAP